MAEKTNADMLFANFNQDFSCISMGTKRGYSITNCDPFGRVYTMNDGPRSIVEMLFCTSLIALVGDSTTTTSLSPSPSSHSSPHSSSPSSSRRKLQIVNTKRQSMVCELLFPTSILAVKLNRKTLVIVLEHEVYIYDISNMRLLHVIETQPNPEGVCALSPSVESSYLAYPSPVPSSSGATTTTTASSASATSNAAGAPHSSTGDVLLFSTRSLTVANAIQAHKAPIAFLALNSTGTMLATSSEKGTVIRVWSVPGAEKLYQFRRGTREARIYCISFNVVGSLMAVSSAHGTVHIFKLGGGGGGAGGSGGGASGGGGWGQGNKGSKGAITGERGSPRSPPESLDGRESTQLEGGYEAFAESSKKGVGSSLTRRSLHLTKSLTYSMGSYLPSSMKEMWDPQRHFASLTLPSAGVRTVVGLSSTMPHVMVISSEGYFYLYSIDLENGGECGLVKQYSLLDSLDVDSSADVPESGGKS